MDWRRPTVPIDKNPWVEADLLDRLDTAQFAIMNQLDNGQLTLTAAESAAMTLLELMRRHQVSCTTACPLASEWVRSKKPRTMRL